MLSKAASTLLRRPLSSARNFSVVRRAVLDLLNRDDTTSPTYINSTFDPARPLEGHRVQLRENAEPRYEISKLPNGVTVLTESTVFPSVVDLGILIDVGTRDETTENSGALLSIKNTLYKTVLNTNETINYGMVQMSGGDFTMDYDQENVYWKAHCLSHDAVDIFRMMTDCAFEPRSVVAANVGQDKNKHSHYVQDIVNTGEQLNDILFRTAFGLRGLGMPLRGLKNNVGNLTAFALQKFQYENINPKRVYVVGAGVDNHQEFVELVSSRLSHMPAVEGSQLRQREKSEYIGGETRNLTDDNEVQLVLAFQSVPWNSQEMYAFNVLNTLLGVSSSFSTGGPGKGMHARTTKNLLNKYHYIDSANALNFHFSDSGLFGLQVGGPSDHANQLLSALIAELKGLTTTIPAEELTRAKNILKSNILMALERQSDRLEEAAKNLKTFGSLVFQQHLEKIDAVTSEQINQVAARVISSRPTLVAVGGEVNRLPSLDKIENQLRV